MQDTEKLKPSNKGYGESQGKSTRVADTAGKTLTLTFTAGPMVGKRRARNGQSDCDFVVRMGTLYPI